MNSLKKLKCGNRHKVLSFMRTTGLVSVSDIARACNLSKMTIHKIIDHFLEKDIIQLAGKGESTEEGGKKPNLFAFNSNYRYIFALRLYGDSMTTTVANLRGENIVEEKACPLGNAAFTDFLDMAKQAFDDQVISQQLDGDRCLGAVVGCNVVVDAENGICLSSPGYESWGINIPIRDSLHSVLPGNVPVYIDNWLRYLAYGEMKAAQSSEPRHRFFLIDSQRDRLSGGLVIDGKIWRGSMGLSGEVGHMIVAPGSNNVCNCGSEGCLEAEVSPARVVARALENQSVSPSSLIFQGKNGSDITFSDVALAANAGDHLARSVLDDAARHFAVAINNIVHSCDPGTIVIRGDYARAGEYFLAALQEYLSRKTSLRNYQKRIRIEYSNLGDEWGLIGAASYLADILFAEDDEAIVDDR